MKKTKQLHLVKETVRNLVPSELSQINGGGCSGGSVTSAGGTVQVETSSETRAKSTATTTWRV